MSKGLTPSQTIGPFYWGTLVNAYRCDLAPPGVAGERIELALSLHDVQGALVPDGLIEIWQANSHGRYNHPDDRRNLPLDTGFEGFGRGWRRPGGRKSKTCALQEHPSINLDHYTFLHQGRAGDAVDAGRV